MKAGDVAAFPQRYGRDWRQPVSEDNPLDIGLTKRELGAFLIAAGMVSAAVHKAERGVAEDAVIYADALLAELAK